MINEFIRYVNGWRIYFHDFFRFRNIHILDFNEFIRYNGDIERMEDYTMPRHPLSPFDKKIREQIAENLKKYTNHLTQGQLSDMTGIPASTLSGYFAMRSTPSPGNLQKIADALNIDKSEIDPRFLLDDSTGTDARKNMVRGPISYGYPYIAASISAGIFEECEAISELPKINVPDLMMGRYAKNPDIVFLHVNGESMNRVIENGALIAVLKQDDRSAYRDGDIVIMTNGRDYTIKHYYDDREHRQIILTPNSTESSFRPIVIPYDNEDGYRLFGKVVIYSVIL